MVASGSSGLCLYRPGSCERSNAARTKICASDVLPLGWRGVQAIWREKHEKHSRSPCRVTCGNVPARSGSSRAREGRAGKGCRGETKIGRARAKIEFAPRSSHVQRIRWRKEDCQLAIHV